jgi:site-specific recombinase XerD
MLKEREQFAQYLGRRYGDRSTPKHYVNDLDGFIRVIGDKEPTAVTVQDVDAYVTHQLENGLKPATINRRLASLGSFFDHLASLEPDKAYPNPVVWRRHAVKRGETLPRDASEADLAALFAVVDNIRDRAMFGLALGSGLRVGELVELTLDGLSLPTKTDEVARLRVMGKGRKERIVWVTPLWRPVLEEWLTVRPPSDSPVIFLNQHRRPLSVAGVEYLFKGYAQKAGVKLTCHQLRHTFARRLAEQRMPTESIGQLLGHNQIKTTQRYTAGANMPLRDDFLQAMAQLEVRPLTPPVDVPPIAAPPRQPEKADPQGLVNATKRLNHLPNWLRQPLQAYLRQRWLRWQPHRAAENAKSLSWQLTIVWDWLLLQRNIAGWETLQRSDVEAWLTARQEAGIQVNTRRTQLTALFGCLRFAQEQELPVAANIFRIAYPEPPQPLPRYLADEDYKRLAQTVLTATDSGSPRDVLDRAWFFTLAHTGVRTCELLNIRLGDLDLARGQLLIRGGKTYCDRVVFLTSALTLALADYLRLRPTSLDDHLWLHGDKPLTTARVRYCVERWGKTAGVQISPHRLRHTLATQLVNQGMPLPSVANLLGHRSLNTTQHYARLFEQTVKEQFVAAIAFFEGIAAEEWPQIVPRQLEFVNNFTDSV